MLSALRPYLPLVAVGAALALANAAYGVLGAEPSKALGLTPKLTLAAWLWTDAWRRRDMPCFDFGFFAYAVWPVILPWYMVRTRGWKGLLLALLIFSILFVAPVVAAVSGAIWMEIRR